MVFLEISPFDSNKQSKPLLPRNLCISPDFSQARTMPYLSYPVFTETAVVPAK